MRRHYNIDMDPRGKARKLFVVLAIIGGLALVLSSFLPFLIALQQ